MGEDDQRRRQGCAAGAASVRLSRAVMRHIRQHLFRAFACKSALIPAAMWVPFGGPALSPMPGAGAMMLSPVCVVAKGRQLRRTG